ncbi:MAG: hypothetical protein C4617_05850 [Candidatus Liberibacter europaeus]|uniref:Bbp19-like phage domain-containing protein n=1 Tax=Candidatus Liberibacter europaeus TaxID=744859 RepID=A0A2T4VW69_9HYPH|nr:hypothetical protein [Candidatus Liberibacter europaeus]PTL86024.1 MAG: hypothetical protein C4617_05850 [Candidatus Liberibacter europaeus]
MTIEKCISNDKEKSDLYKRVFATEDGRLVLMDLMIFGGLLSVNEHEDPINLARQEGKRSISIKIVNLIGITDDEIIKDYRSRI